MKKLRSTASTIEKDSGPEYSVVRARYLIRRLQGKSRSVLALCDDDHYYVIKFERNPKGANALANEILGYQLASGVHIPVPASGLVYVSSELLRWAPKDWFDEYGLGCKPSQGLHFATRFVGTPLDEGTSDFLPRVRMPFLSNRADFVGMLVLDIWANHQRSRQVVFHRVGMRRLATFIDCGSMFGGSECKFCDEDFAGFYFDIAFYEKNIEEETVDTWIRRIRSNTPKILTMAYGQIPEGWYTPAYDNVRDVLLERLKHLETLVYPVIKRLRD